MKKIYMITTLICLLPIATSFANEGDQSESNPATSFFEEKINTEYQSESHYRYDNLDTLQEDLDKNPSETAEDLIKREKDASIEKKDFSATTKAHNQQRLLTISSANQNRQNKCNQWWDRSVGLAVGIVSTLAVVGSIVFFQNISIANAIKDLATKIPAQNNEQLTAAVRDGIGQIIAVLPKKED